jgi:two-component system LytT family response regulator
MIRTIIIDDERHAIREIEHFLEEYPEIEVAATYTDPLKALEELKVRNPQLVFLDINMPGMQGMDVGARILDAFPEMKIVFVTAYEQYAIEAFDLNAIDYILKPIQRARFEKTMRKISKGITKDVVSSVKRLVIKSFGMFRIGWENELPIKWRTEKTKELFAYLLMHAGLELSRDLIIDALWGDTDVDRAVRQLHNCIYYIRKTMEEYGIDRGLISISGTYCLSIGDVDFDKPAWNRLKASPVSEMTISIVEDIYRGDYLEGADWAWTDIDRENLMNDYIRMIGHCAKNHVRNKDFIQAEVCLLKATGKNPYDETIAFQLMKLYVDSSKFAKAIKYFSTYSEMLKADLKIEPARDILELYNSLR